MTHSEISHSSTSVGNALLMQMIMVNDALELKPCEYTEHKLLDIENDIDPDNHFFSNINDKCYYYTDEQYNQTIKAEGK